MSLKRISNITEPDDDILTLEEARTQCYLTGSSEDAFLTALIKTVSRSCENFTWRQLPEAQYEYRMDEFPDDIIELPKNPVISIEKIEYVTGDGTQTLSSGLYRTDLNSEPARIEPVNSWPDTKDQMDAVIITFTCGYNGTDHTLPEDIKTGMKMLIKYLFDNRDAVAVSEGRTLDIEELPFGVKWMWIPHSLRSF